jgi:dynactin-4
MFSLSKVEYAGGDGGRIAEAGKVWEKGRNWTTVVVEVVGADVTESEETAEDGDVLEIPVFVRMDWEAEVEREEGAGGGKGEERKEKRELAYWVVVGVGRVGRLDGSI